MKKNLGFLLALVAVVTTLSSCKKAAVTDTSILTSHKWVLTSDLVTYSDSVGVSHNQIHNSPTCLDTTWFEFHDYTTNSTVRALYQYTSNHCTNTSYVQPLINVGSWDIDRDNANLLLNTTGTNALNGNWLAIKTINSNTLVLTTVSEQVATYIGNYPNQTAVYHTVTETLTFGTL
jgi:hypothetical protein